MATTTKEYAVILTTDYYGPSTTHTLVSDPTEDRAAAEAIARVEDAGPMYLGHNEASYHTSVWEVDREIDYNDWCGWPEEMAEAACELLGERGIDHADAEAVMQADFDVPSEAAQRIGMCVVSASNGRMYLCSPIEERDGA